MACRGWKVTLVRNWWRYFLLLCWIIHYCGVLPDFSRGPRPKRLAEVGLHTIKCDSRILRKQIAQGNLICGIHMQQTRLRDFLAVEYCDSFRLLGFDNFAGDSSSSTGTSLGFPVKNTHVSRIANCLLLQIRMKRIRCVLFQVIRLTKQQPGRLQRGQRLLLHWVQGANRMVRRLYAKKCR